MLESPAPPAPAPGEDAPAPAPARAAGGGGGERPLAVTFLLKRSDLSGGVRVVRAYAERLRGRGHRVVVVSCADPPEPLLRRLKRGLKGEGWKKRPPRVPGHMDASGLPHRVLPGGRTPDAGDLPDADVLVTTWWETAEWARGWPARKGRPLYLVQHDERVFDGITPEQRRRVEETWRLGCPKVAVAGWIAREMREAGAEDVHVILNALDPELFHAPPRPKRPVPTVGLMHSHARFKGVDVAVEAIRIARESLPRLAVEAFGSGPLEGSLLEGLPGVTYHRQPPQDEIRGVYAACDAWLFGSRCEGFGLPILEAMACRTPVIGTPAGAAPELLGPPPGGEAAGLLVPMEDPAAMAEAIVRVAGMDEGRWRALSERAHATATRYTWDEATDLLEAQIRRVAAA